MSVKANVPFSVEMEQGALSALLQDPARLAHAREAMKPYELYKDAHRAIYEAMLYLYDNNESVDTITLSDELMRRGCFVSCGGHAYLSTLLDAAPTPEHFATYAQGVRRDALRRDGIQKAHEVKTLLQSNRLADGTEVQDGLDYIARSNGHYHFSRMVSEVEKGNEPMCLDAITSETVEWFWPDWLPVGKFVVMSGDPGIYKSGISLTLAAILSKGAPMPLRETPSGEPRNTLLFVAEDGIADTVRPKLEAAGADMKRIFAYTSLQMPEVDLTILERIIREKSISLVVFDPLNSFIPESADGQTSVALRRKFLSPLTTLSEQYRCTILGLAHLNKMASVTNAVYRSSGRIDFVAAARVAMLCAKDPTGDGYILARSKGNLSKEPQPIRYHIEHDLEFNAPYVVWDGVAIGMDADSLLSPKGVPVEKTAADDALLLLVTELRDGPTPVEELKVVAKGAGVAWRTIERAKAGIVRSRRVGGADAYWAWELLPRADRDAKTQARIDHLFANELFASEEGGEE